MNTRTNTTKITFAHAFTFNGAHGQIPAGTYDVETTDEQIDGLSFVAYRRTGTSIRLPNETANHHSWQIVEIDPADLDRALARDTELTANATGIATTAA